MEKTKIVATLGPATESREKIEQLVEAGVDVFRLNFSHFDPDEHSQIYDRVREVSGSVAVMLDTKGPEIRLLEVEEGTELEAGEEVELVTEDVIGNSERLAINRKELVENAEEGDDVLVDDGKLELKIDKVEESSVTCKVIHGGEVLSRKSVNVPGRDLGLEAPTEKDVEDLEYGAEKDFDFVSLSFVKKAEDVKKAREILEENGSNADIIAKIEHLEAVNNFDSILEASDGIMIARGDLGVEAEAARVPLMQKEQIRKCNRAAKPVITATQMLESMTENPAATRAETSDVANAVMDGTDAVMLSGETTIGEYPVRSVEYMSEIIREVESSNSSSVHHTIKEKTAEVADIICKNAWQAAQDTDAKYIVSYTSSGSTARKLAKYRPRIPIIAFTEDREVYRKLSLVWGVRPVSSEFEEHVDNILDSSVNRLKEMELVEDDDLLVLCAGIPAEVPDITNMLQIRTVEDLLDAQEG